MKKCPHCGASINPFMVKCEYCRSLVFDWDTWLKDGEPCYINYNFNNDEGTNFTLIAKAIPRFESIEINSDSMDVIDKRGNIYRKIMTNKTCEIHAIFKCVRDDDNVLYKLMENRT